MTVWTELVLLRIGSVVGPCERDDGISDYIKAWKFLGKPSDSQELVI
jgi:hypothetical protein